MITASTITTDTTRAIFHALMTAAERSRRVMRQAEDGEVSPEIAAAQLNNLLDRMHMALAEAIDPAPPVPETLTYLVTP